jgi:hypothetical protein
LPSRRNSTTSAPAIPPPPMSRPRYRSNRPCWRVRRARVARRATRSPAVVVGRGSPVSVAGGRVVEESARTGRRDFFATSQGSPCRPQRGGEARSVLTQAY